MLRLRLRCLAPVLATEHRRRLTGAECQLDHDELADMIARGGDMVADPVRKTGIYASLGLRLTFYPGEARVLVSQGNADQRFVSEGRVEPFAYAGALSADFLAGGAA